MPMLFSAIIRGVIKFIKLNIPKALLEKAAVGGIFTDF